VFWVDYGSEASIDADFAKIGEACGWSTGRTQVKDQLASSTKSSLLILDNCDDVQKDYPRYIPNSPKVSVILTTRRADANKYASRDPQDEGERLFLPLSGLDEESAIKLLLTVSETHAPDPQTIRQAKQIVSRLDFHPLAINVAGSLIQGCVNTIEEYAQALETMLTQKELLNYPHSEDARYKKITATFEVSADYLKELAKTDPSAKGALCLLDILGFMHHQDVSEEIFLRAFEYEGTVLADLEDEDYYYASIMGSFEHLSEWHVAQCRGIFSSLPPDQRIRLFQQSRFHLYRLSLVKLDPKQKCMSLHLLVHAWMRDRVPNPIEKCTAVGSLLTLSARGSRNWQPYTAQLAIHCQANFTIQQALGEPTIVSLDVCRIWYVYVTQLDYHSDLEALKVCTRLQEQTEKNFHNEPEHPSLTITRTRLAFLHFGGGQGQRAVEIMEQVKETHEDLPEGAHERLNSRLALGAVYRRTGQHDKAIETIEHVLVVYQREEPENDVQLQIVEQALARAYREGVQPAKAVEMLERAVNRGDILEESEDRLNFQRELTKAYLANKETAKAVQTLRHVIALEERTLPGEHPDRRDTRNILATLYGSLGDEQAALRAEMLEYAVQSMEALPETNVVLISTQRMLAVAWYETERNAEVVKALELMEHVVKVQEHLPDDDSETEKSEILLAFIKAQVEKFSPERGSAGSTARDPEPDPENPSLWTMLKLHLRGLVGGC
jgi:tetratricopeptide (TPR) repeat protein